jgi:hypothetical protein
MACYGILALMGLRPLPALNRARKRTFVWKVRYQAGKLLSCAAHTSARNQNARAASYRAGGQTDRPIRPWDNDPV